MARYGLATIFEDHPVEHEFAANNLPLHLSHIDSFETELGVEELIAALRNLLSGQRIFTVQALADEYYGPQKDIPVTTLELTSELKNFHNSLVGFLKRQGAVLRHAEFNGDNFSPHVSIYGTKRIAAGSPILINDISLSTKVSDAHNASRRVLANFDFI